MHQAMAPRPSRGGWRILLTLALAAAFPLSGAAQSARKGADGDEPKAKASKADAKAKGKDDAAKDRDDGGEAPAPKADPDVFLDPLARDAMQNAFPELFKNENVAGVLADRALKDILLMARGSQPYDAKKVAAFLRQQAARLTSHRNIDAMTMSPDDVADKKISKDIVDSISDAGSALVEPIKAAAATGNNSFRRDFTAALLDKDILPRLLTNHLYARTQAMVALSQTGEPAALETFINVLRDKDQPLSVKILAADGIANIARGGRRAVEPPQTAISAAKAVAFFLGGGEADPFWPAQAHGLKALGALRLATVDQNAGRFELAALAEGYLADPKRHPEVRADAAWALGMMRISGQKERQFNYPLVAHDMGQLAAELADRALAANVVALSGKEKDPTDVADYLTGLLVYQVFFGLNRDPDVQNSGLLNAPALAQNLKDKSAVQDILKDVRATAAAAVELHRAAGSLAADAQKALEARIKALKATLEKNAPAKRDIILAAP